VTLIEVNFNGYVVSGVGAIASDNLNENGKIMPK